MRTLQTSAVLPIWRVVLALGMVALFACMSILPNAADAAEVIGTVAKQRADAYGTPPDGQRGRKYPRYDVVFGEHIETSGGGAILIRLKDKTELYLGERANLTIDEFVYDPTSNQGQAAYGFAIGTLRFVSGSMLAQGVTIQTPNTNIGIRGSDAIIFVTPAGDTIVNVTKGSFSVRSRERADVPTVYLVAGQNVSVSGVATFSAIGTGIKFPEYSEDPDAKIPDYSEDYDYVKEDGGFDSNTEGSRDPGGRAPGDHSDPGGHHDAPD